MALEDRPAVHTGLHDLRFYLFDGIRLHRIAIAGESPSDGGNTDLRERRERPLRNWRCRLHPETHRVSWVLPSVVGAQRHHASAAPNPNLEEAA